ncbi:MAG: hypothetical protein A2Z88_00450 [Omnitrophica WOR_2 bacterium GWA2_47_8]|nr:MAG: hypothetical protein A2Z88_00450 [Omnitrophica WOR_2 bacterium GWA2_47_8]
MEKKKIQSFTVVIEQDEDGWYVGWVPTLKGCHTQGKTIDELMVRIKEAIELCLEVEQDEAENTRFVGVQQVDIPL